MATMTLAEPAKSSRPAKAGRDHTRAKTATTTTWPITLLLISFLVPWLLDLGPITLPMYRIVLLALTVPCALLWVSGQAGRIRVADIALLLFCLWAAVCLWVANPGSTLEAGGSLFIETFGAYLIARCYIRTAEQFLHMIRLMFILVACLLPFAAFEAITGNNIARSLFTLILPTYQPPNPPEIRAGLARAMVVMDHPILFGLFTGCTLALVHLALGRGKSLTVRWLRSGIMVMATFFSLSSAPIGAAFMQIMLIGWNWTWRSFAMRWKLLWALIALSYVLIDLLSSQNPIQFYVSRFTFDPQTAWFRFMIWDYGTASIAANPIFGVGLGEWARPAFMGPSVDNFWLIIPMRYGLPGGFLFSLAFAAIYLRVSFSRQPSTERTDYRTAYLITMTALFLIGWSVHFWGPPYVLLMLLMGSGIWFLEPETEQSTITSEGSSPAVARPRGGVAVLHRSSRQAVLGGSKKRDATNQK